MAKVNHTPAVAAVRDEWRLGDERIVRGGDSGEYEYEIFGIDDDNEPAGYASSAGLKNLFSVMSSILGASESRRLVDEQHGAPVAVPEKSHPPRPKRIVVTEIASGDSYRIVVGKAYAVESWDSDGRPQVRIGNGGLWYLSDRQGAWDTRFSTFSKWVPYVESEVF